MKFPVRPALHVLVDNDAHSRPSSTYKSGMLFRQPEPPLNLAELLLVCRPFLFGFTV